MAVELGLQVTLHVHLRRQFSNRALKGSGTKKASGCDGSPPGGQHRSGTLVFPSLAPGTETVKLIIKGIGKDTERIFTWQVRP